MNNTNIIKLITNSATYSLLVITVLVFILATVFEPQTVNLKLYFWQNPNFAPWQFVGYMFLHGSISHLLFNMIALFSFGRVLERAWGNQRFFIFYFACGIGAGIVYLIVNYLQFNAIYQQLLQAGLSVSDIQQLLSTGKYYPGQVMGVGEAAVTKFYHLYHVPAVGASGAIYGILVAFAMLFPNFKVMLIFLPVPIAAKYFVPVLLLIDLLAGVTGFSIFGYNIAHFAHLGGAVAGFLLVQFWLHLKKH